VDPSQLDGVSVIVGALAAGAGDGLKDVTKGAVTGAAYSVGQGLQAARDKLAGLLKSRFHGNEDATADLNVYLRRPTPENAEPLAGHILQAGLDHDQQIRPPPASCSMRLDRPRSDRDRSPPRALARSTRAGGPGSSVGSTCIITGPPHRLPQRIGSSSTSVARCSSSATSGPGPRMMSFSTHRVRSGSILPETCPRGARGLVASSSRSAARRRDIPGWWCGGRTPSANRRPSPGNDHCRNDESALGKSRRRIRL